MIEPGSGRCTKTTADFHFNVFWQLLDTLQRGVQWMGVVLYSKLVYNVI